MSDKEETDEDMRFMLARSLVRDLGVNHVEARKMVNHWQDEVRAEAWDEGHQTTQVLGPDDCQCHAWCECECACGLYGTGDILTSNPYRQEKES